MSRLWFTWFLAIVFFIVLGLALPAQAFDRKERISAFTEMIKAELALTGKPFDWTIEDTGKNIDVGQGESPIVSVTVPGKHICAVAIHPTETSAAVLGCNPLPPSLRPM